MLMQRSSSDPLAVAHGHRRRASDSSRSPPIRPSCPPSMLRRHYSCSASSSTDSSSPLIAAARAPAAPVASPTETPSDDPPSPRTTFGTFNGSVVGVSMPILPEPISMEIAVAPPPSPPRPGFNTNIMPASSFSPPAPPAQTEMKTEAAASAKVLGGGSGTCMVCLEDCEDVIGSACLHPRPSTAAENEEEGGVKKVNECGVSACAACLKTYFTGIVEAGFDGACPRMRCMCCPRVVCEPAWAPLVEPDVLETFQKRASTLLSIQCGMCHNRGTIMVVPPSDHCYSSATEKLMGEASKALDSSAADSITTPTSVEEEEKTRDDAPTTPTATAAATTTTVTSNAAAAASDVALIDTAVDNDSKPESKTDSSARNAKLLQSFRAELELYTSGDQVDVSSCYAAFEGVFGSPGGREMDQDARNDLMMMLMSSVEDSERRANLHIRFIRSNPMITTKCCKALHCFRCRVVGGHAPLNCDQYEAQRGHEDVCKCPGCGVYVVKGDGCNAITCICGHNFSWSELVNDRNRQVANAFRDAYPDNTDRLAAEIIRRGPPAAGTDAVNQAPPDTPAGPVTAAAAGGNIPAGANGSTVVGREETAPMDSMSSRSQGEGTDGQERQAQPPASTPEGDDAGWSEWVTPAPENAGGWGQEWVDETDGWVNEAPHQELVQEPVPAPQEAEREEAAPAGNGPLSAEDNFRLANAYAQAYPREITRARAEVYGEENPHFTVQRARIQRHRETWRTLAPALSIYAGRPRPVVSPPSDAEAEWEAIAAANWLTENRIEVSAVERREAAARLSLVETFYGDDSRLQHNTAIAHTAAEHARAALRVATPLESPMVPASNQYNPEEEESLFKWLGIVEPSPPVLLPEDGNGPSCDGEGAAEGEEEEWTLPFADYEFEQGAPEVIPAPSSLWTPWPRGRLAPSRPKNRGRSAMPDPATRVVSAVETFGSVPIRREVERWVAGTDARQAQLRNLMAVEERELSNAWVALWGRRLRLDSSTRAWVDDNGGDDAAVRSAARRVVFLEGHPEQACREQAAMMKAFVRRNGAALAKAKEESKFELAAAWEKLHATKINLPSTATAAEFTTSTLSQAYDAYLRYTKAKTSAALAEMSMSPTSTATRDLDLRRTGRMAEAWMWKNLRWVRAQRFADRFAESAVTLDNNSGGNNNAAAFAAVVALVAAPMLLCRSPLMCDCGMDTVCSDAVDWVSFNEEAFEKEFDKVDGNMSNGEAGGAEGGTGRAIEGCECPQRDGALSCARLVACPVVTRRILKAEPVCTACEEEDDFLSGELFDLFS